MLNLIKSFDHDSYKREKLFLVSVEETAGRLID
ncbi:MAG: hypothetical protein US90_C0024G0011 [Candidatus Shapirobacteria bacterium GW2011_GWE2_38_30]|uniref:Uncharacterized protein n=1 Tax=Candidatus Shapirobacteria bacterium GW2011_GWE2_38_30 TaxID=1618490 RepID=A0A0G0JYY7_9BACT|nr:MAG: hypothetical protein US90_C0024G0011 [Candidatus Shapirobacteria bacterium GW2011_GWE2_38_30]